MTIEEARIDGARISMLACGEGEPVVLLHGTPTSAELWRDVLPLLAAAGYHALAPDLPGYGATRIPPAADHSLTGSAELLADWLGRGAIGPSWVVGHDLGGAVAQILAIRSSHLVSRLTLLNSVADVSFPAPRARMASAAARLGLHRLTAGLGLVPNAYMRRQLQRGLVEPGRDHTADLDRVVWDGKFSDPRGRAAFERHLGALSGRDLRTVADRLGELSVPCQLIWGMRDPFQTWQVAGRHLAELLPDPSVTLLRGCGHLAPLEFPRQVADALVGWREPPVQAEAGPAGSNEGAGDDHPR